MSSKSNIQETLFAILRSAIGTGEKISGVRLGTREWERLFGQAFAQNVGALVYDELTSAGVEMPRSVRCRWEEYSRLSAGRFDAQLLCLTQLSAMLEAEGVRMMALKGVGLALNYPKPQLRECVDVDIFCFDDYYKVNDFILRSGIDKNGRETLEEKHFVFELGGIEVENHRKFCSDNVGADSLVGKVLMKMVSQTPPEQDPRIPGILLPPVQMGALHLIIHTLSHLVWSGITLRHLCDVTLYFRKNRGRIDVPTLRSVLKDAGVERSAALLLDLCNRHLGLGMDLSLWPGYERKDADTVLHSLFHHFKSSSLTRNPLHKFYRKVRTHRFKSRLCRIVYGERFSDSFLESFAALK